MKRLKRIISLILAFVVLSADIAATLEAKEPETEIETGNVSDKFEAVYQKTGQYLYTKVKEPVVSSSGGEWAVIGLARSEYEAGESYYKKYAANVGNVVRSKKGILHERKYTEYSRVILALTSIGYDVTKVAGYNLLEPLADYQSVIWQGINGPIWALIALDSHNYQIPAAPAGAEQTTREKLLETILSAEAEGGGWALSGEGADVDMTAMAIQALAPYCGDDRVQAAVNRGLARISSMQDDNGGFGSYETANSESCSQVIVALCALGIDPKQDARVVKKGVSVLDALLSYEVKEGGFRHILSGGADGMATEQAYYAMTAYQRFRKNQRRLLSLIHI